MFKVIDTHTHFDAEEFDEDRAEAFARAKEAGVGKVFLPAIDVKTTHAVLALAKEYPGYAYPMIGLHPEEVKADWKEQLAELRKILEEHRMTGNACQEGGSPQFSDLIAIGEVGLDYYWSREFEHEQLKAFEEQVKWSVETQLPLMIHCRKAQNEMVHLLRKYEKELPGGVFHCFTGNQKEAEELLSFDKFVLGIGGIFFMALTLVLVSFSCTGPIVGTVLIKSTQGEFWTPMVTMLAFSVAFALPFTVLAMFPSLLKKMKGKSGSWLNSVKVVLGFIEVALGFKFLSVADQTYHWGLLDREVYLGIWVVTFSMLGFYLLGKLRFKNDDPVEHVSVPRLGLAIAVFTFVAYMIPGMWGAPLKALSGYLPPMETQDFVVWNYADSPSGQAARSGSTATVAAEKTGAVGDAASNAISAYGQKYDLKMPLGLSGYFTLEEGLAAAKAQNKPLFVDITGHGCVNCREMEQRVWSDPRVLNILRNEYVLVALYVDDKTKLDEQDWLTTADGKVLKQIGRANSYIARTRFGVNAQPNYALLDPDGNPLSPVRGYDLSVEGFTDFLNSGLRK